MRKLLFLLLPGVALTGCIIRQPVPVGSENFGYTYDLRMPVVEQLPPATPTTYVPPIAQSVAVQSDIPGNVPTTPPLYEELPPPRPRPPQPPRQVVVVPQPQRQVIREPAGAAPQVQQPQAAPGVAGGGYPGVTVFGDGGFGGFPFFVTNTNVITNIVTNITSITNTNPFTPLPTNLVAGEILTNDAAGAENTNAQFNTNAPILITNRTSGDLTNQEPELHTPPSEAVTNAGTFSFPGGTNVNEPAGAQPATQTNQQFNFGTNAPAPANQLLQPGNPGNPATQPGTAQPGNLGNPATGVGGNPPTQPAVPPQPPRRPVQPVAPPQGQPGAFAPPAPPAPPQ